MSCVSVRALKIIAVGTILLVALALMMLQPEWIRSLKDWLSGLSFGPFLALMVVLPVFGFPISLFLILGGIRFGIGWGLLSMGVSFPLHMAAVYLLTRSLLRPRLESFLERRDYRMPEIPSRRAGLYTSLFVAVPSLPYIVKN